MTSGPDPTTLASARDRFRVRRRRLSIIAALVGLLATSAVAWYAYESFQNERLARDGIRLEAEVWVVFPGRRTEGDEMIVVFEYEDQVYARRIEAGRFRRFSMETRAVDILFSPEHPERVRLVEVPNRSSGPGVLLVNAAAWLALLWYRWSQERRGLRLLDALTWQEAWLSTSRVRFRRSIGNVMIGTHVSLVGVIGAAEPGDNRPVWLADEGGPGRRLLVAVYRDSPDVVLLIGDSPRRRTIA